MLNKPQTDVDAALSSATTARRDAERSRHEVAALVARLRGRPVQTGR